MSQKDAPVVGQPTEQLEISDNVGVEEEIVYPTGITVWLSLGAMYTAAFLYGLDLTIVAVAIPALTDHFKTVDDIGWYSAAYGLTASAFIPLFGKACTVFYPKRVVLLGLTCFLLGSLLCTFAQSSKVFVGGRAVCGFGISAVSSGSLTLIANMFPSHKRSIWLSLGGIAQTVGLSCAPIIGGALIDRFGWRACFGINLPLCPLVIIFTAFFLDAPIRNPNFELSLKDKLKQMDILGTLLVAPSITCLLLGLQWGGIKYGWTNGRIITLFVVFVVLMIGFVYLQYRLGERATIPPRIIKKRTILAAMWFGACCNGILAITEAYTAVYWQGVRGESATTAGLLGVSMIIGLAVGALLGGLGTAWIGYFTPFMYVTSILSPIAAGLLTTLDLDEDKVKVVALLGFLGLSVGSGLGAPIQAVAAVLSPQEISLGTAVTGFAGGMGSALFITAAATLFQNRLVDEISEQSPGANITAIGHAGLSDLRNIIGQDRLKDVLSGYNRATVQTLYMPLGLTLLTVIASATVGWPSVKRKQN